MVDIFIYCVQAVALLGSGLALFVLLAAVPYSVGRLSGRREYRKQMIASALEKSLEFELWVASEKLKLAKKNLNLKH